MWGYRLVAPFRFEQEDVPDRTAEDLKPGQVLVQTNAVGICGSDLPFFRGRMLPTATVVEGRVLNPIGIPSHEVAGEVVASRDDSIPIGAAVVGWASSGSLVERAVVEGSGLLVYDTRWQPEEAIVIQPLACVLYALGKLPSFSGAHAAVIGQGPIGILFSHALKTLGADHVTGVDRVDRTDFAEVFLVDSTVHSSSEQWAASLGPDAERPALIVEAVGHQVGTLTDAVAALPMHGHVYYFGIPDDEIYPFPMRSFLRKVCRLTAGWTPPGPARAEALRQAEAYLADYSGLPKHYVTNLFKIDEVNRAFELALRPSEGQMKVVLKC